MTNEPIGFHQPSCAEIAPLLEKQIAREPLDEEEQKSVTHHLSTCKACEDFLTWTSGWPIFSDQVSEKTMQSLIAQAADRHFSAKRTRKIAVAVGFAGALAAAAIALLLVLPETVDDSSSSAVAAACIPTPAAELAAGVMITQCTQSTIDTSFEDGELRVTLKSGAVGLSVDPHRPRKQIVSVVTPFGKVLVRGTVFTVHIEQNEARVEVLRGTVLVRGNDAGDAGVEVKKGNGARMVEHRQFALSNPKQNLFYPILFPPDAAVKPGRDGAQSGATTEPSTAMLQSDDAGEPLLSTEPPSLGTDDGPVEGPTRGRIVALDELWAQSRNCLIERDWLCASAKYRQILKQHAGRRESLAALISLAKIELRHLGKPDAALRHFSAYRQQYPKGPLMEEAVWGLAESHRQLGNKPQELGILRSFTRDYPNSSLAPRVHRRIKEIEKTVSN